MENQVSSPGRGNKRSAPVDGAAAATAATVAAPPGAGAIAGKAGPPAGGEPAPKRIALGPLEAAPNAPGMGRAPVGSSPMTPAGAGGPVVGATTTIAAAGGGGGTDPPVVYKDPAGAAKGVKVVDGVAGAAPGAPAAATEGATTTNATTVTPARPPAGPSGTGRRRVPPVAAAAAAAAATAAVAADREGNTGVEVGAAVAVAAAAAAAAAVAATAAPNLMRLVSPAPGVPVPTSPVAGDTDRAERGGAAAATAGVRVSALPAARALAPPPPAGAGDVRGRVGGPSPAAGPADGGHPRVAAASPVGRQGPGLGVDGEEEEEEGAEEEEEADDSADASLEEEDGMDSWDGDAELAAVGESPLSPGGAVHPVGVVAAPPLRGVVPLSLSVPDAEAQAGMLEGLLATAAGYPPVAPPRQVSQRPVTPRTRTITVDWMVEVCDSLRVCRAAMYGAVNMMDRVLVTLPVSQQKVQVVAITCIFIASKIHDTFPMTAEQAVEITARLVTIDALRNAESMVLSALSWRTLVPTVASFFPHLVRAGLRGAGVSPGGPDWRLDVQYLAYMLSEVSLLDGELSRSRPQLATAAAVCLALGARGLPPWSAEFGAAVGLDVADVAPAYGQLLWLWRHAHGARNAANVRERIPDYLFEKYWNVELHTPPPVVPDLE